MCPNFAFLSLFLRFILFMDFWLCWVFTAAHGLSLAVVSEAILHCRMRASHCGSFSGCGAQAPRPASSVTGAYGSVAVSLGL